MKVAIRARFDGEVFVPEEPVDLAEGERVLIQVLSPVPFAGKAVTPEEVEAVLAELRMTALERFVSRGVSGVNLPDEALRRESIYED
ncbi:MAG: antitoxin family protein [Chthonomonadetes bacterium]|nr:antitoxin family protein [Chthonomonadetes bacterium]